MDDYEEKLGRRILPQFTQNINSRDFILLVHKHNPDVLSLNELARLTKEMDCKPDVDVNLNILLTMRRYPGWFQCILDVCGDPLFKRSWLKTKFEEIKRQLDESLNGQAPPAQASVAAPAAEDGRVTTRQGASSMATLETDNVISFYNNGVSATCENLGMNSEELGNIDKTAEDEKKSNNLEEEQECSQAVVESKNGDDTGNDVDATEVENKCKAGEESEQKDDRSASAEDDKKSETGKESSEVDNTCNEKASESINNDNTEDVMDIAEQIVENKAVQGLEQEKETVSVEDNEKSKYFTDVKERSPVDNDKEVPENIKDTENVKHTEEKKIKDILQAVQESKQKEDSPDKDIPDVPESSQETVINSSPQENTEAVQESKQKEDSPDKDVPDVPESSQETVIYSSPQENTEAGPVYSNKDFETEGSAGSDTDKNSESEDNSSEMGACISNPKSHSKKRNSKIHRDHGFSDDDDCDPPEEDHEKPGNGKAIQYLSIVWTVLSYILHFVVRGCRKFFRTLFKIPVGLQMLYYYTFQGPENKKLKKEKQEVQTTMTSYVSTEQRGEKQGGKSEEKKEKWSLSRKDTDNYRNGYPGKKDNPRWKDNLKFYKGEIQCSPDGDFIDKIHEEWWGDYDLLERHHGYIQWIFPIREEGMNWQAQPLQKHEAEEIIKDPAAHARVLESYKMMLDFYGMKLVNDETGQLKRTKNYADRFENLNWSSHNYLRITRILKSLGEFDYEHLKKGFVQFALEEALVHRTLPRILTSCRDYWIGTIKNKDDRDELHEYIRDNIE